MKLFRRPFTAMGGPCELQGFAGSQADADAAFDRAQLEVRRIEQKYSRYRADSELSRINRSAGSSGLAVDEETAALLDFAGTMWRQSDRAFDVTSGVLRRAWDFKAGRVPAADEVAALLRHVGWQRLQWHRPQLQLPAGMELDLGGFGKEYAADCACRELQAAGIHHGLVDLGGDLALAGPHPDGSPWHAGIRNPRDPTRAIATLSLSGGALATSGDYERYFESGGRRYCHILDARTGLPVEGLASVSVVAPHCMVAGAATTVAMLKGVEAGPAWLSELGLAWLAVDSAGTVSGTLARSA